jgi:hypothetical protein
MMTKLIDRLTSPLSYALTGCGCQAIAAFSLLSFTTSLFYPAIFFVYAIFFYILAYATYRKRQVEPPVERYGPCRTFVTVKERASDSVWVGNMEIIAEEGDGMGHYRFIKPNGQFIDLDLSENGWQIVRRKVFIDISIEE